VEVEVEAASPPPEHPASTPASPSSNATIATRLLTDPEASERDRRLLPLSPLLPLSRMVPLRRIDGGGAAVR
jgi:hypothetical protein